MAARSLREETVVRPRGPGRPRRVRPPEEIAQRALTAAEQDDETLLKELAKGRAGLEGEPSLDPADYTMVSVPLEATRRIKNRSMKGRKLREFVLFGNPKAKLLVDERGECVMAVFHLGIDVPSCPRLTQNMLWTKEGREYAAWKQVYRATLRKALANAGWPGADDLGPISRSPKTGPKIQGPTLFGPRLAREFRLPGRKTAESRPLTVHFYLHTQLHGDWDNRLKAVMDACNKLLWPDDVSSAGGSGYVDYRPTDEPWNALTVIVPGKEKEYALYAEQQDAMIRGQTPQGALPFKPEGRR